MNDHERCRLLDPKAADQRRYRFTGEVHERCGLGQRHTLLANAYFVDEGPLFSCFQAAVMSTFKQVDDGKAHVVARTVVLRSWIAKTDNEYVGRRAASGAIAAPAAKCHLLGVALGGSLCRGSFATVGGFALGRTIFHREACGETKHELNAVVDISGDAGRHREGRNCD